MIGHRSILVAGRLQSGRKARYIRFMATGGNGIDTSAWARRWVFYGISTVAGVSVLNSFYQYHRANGLDRIEHADSPNVFDKASKSARVAKNERPSCQEQHDQNSVEKPQEASILPDWSRAGDKISDAIVPDWAHSLPEYIAKLQKELSTEPDSLGEEMWQEAHDPEANPEITWDATVRVSDELCNEEKDFIQKRKHHTRIALAHYLDIPEAEIYPDDVPTIALCGSGGGLRALVAGSSSYHSAQESGLFDCATYTAGVSGSCWLQTLYHSTLANQNFSKLLQHLKNRINIHIAFPPPVLQMITSAPTHKFLLSGGYEKWKGAKNAEFGLVDVYGLLLGARLLVPKGELGVEPRNLKISKQRGHLESGAHPLPIYTAVRHELPAEETVEKDFRRCSIQEEAKKEAWFQWFELTPYELWCEELGSGIPTWSVGRQFHAGRTIRGHDDSVLPEIRVTLLMGIWGSAFCATLSHYYKEIRPIVKGLTGFGGLDQMLEDHNEDLIKLHPIQPAQIPNYAMGMKEKLPERCPDSIHGSKEIQLMDAGMSNNLPIYPLLRPGRDVDVIIAFDASADIKKENWLRVADGYARQRGIKGWPLGSGWPPQQDPGSEDTGEALEVAEGATEKEATQKIDRAADQQAKEHQKQNAQNGSRSAGKQTKKTTDLGYCNVWVGTTEERQSAAEPPQSKQVEEDWELMQPDSGIAVVYFPFMANPKVPGVDPEKSDFMSTWNFIYTPENIEQVVDLARANFREGEDRTKETIRAVYERKKRKRLQLEGEIQGLSE